MAHDPTKRAIDVMARDVIATSVEPEWGYYPEIGEDDWLAVVARVEQMVEASKPSQEVFEAALEHLSQRADGQAS